MSVDDDNQNEEPMDLDNQDNENTPEPMEIEGDNDMDDMEIDNGNDYESATQFPFMSTATTVGVEYETISMEIDSQDEQDIAEPMMMETDDMDMQIDSFDDEVDKLANLFAGLMIATPYPDINEVAIKFGHMSIANVDPVWIVHDDPMEVDDPMDLD